MGDLKHMQSDLNVLLSPMKTAIDQQNDDQKKAIITFSSCLLHYFIGICLLIFFLSSHFFWCIKLDVKSSFVQSEDQN